MLPDDLESPAGDECRRPHREDSRHVLVRQSQDPTDALDAIGHGHPVNTCCSRIALVRCILIAWRVASCRWSGGCRHHHRSRLVAGHWQARPGCVARTRRRPQHQWSHRTAPSLLDIAATRAICGAPPGSREVDAICSTSSSFIVPADKSSQSTPTRRRPVPLPASKTPYESGSAERTRPFRPAAVVSARSGQRP